jgi:parallel beta-helix repeat protein
VRAAVDAATSGDTILIAPGIHGGGVYITGKALTLASWFLTTQDTTYIAQTVIDTIVGSPCGSTGSCAGNAVLEFASDASGSAVIGLTIQNGEDGVRSRAVMDLAYCRVLSNADGIDFQNGGGGTIRNNLVANNSDDGIDLNGAINGVVRDNIVRDNHQDGVEFRLYAYSGPVVQVDFVRNHFLDNGGDGIQLIDYPDASSRVIRMERNYFRGNLDAAVGCMPDGQTSENFVGAPIADAST